MSSGVFVDKWPEARRLQEALDTVPVQKYTETFQQDWYLKTVHITI